MKKKLFVLLLLIFGAFAILQVSKPLNIVAEDNLVDIVENSSELLTLDYLDFYSIPTSQFSYSNNGGELSGYELSKAFDRNFTTSFKSKIDNNVTYTNPETNEQIPNFLNYIEIDFSVPVTIDRLIYGSENNTTRGYPIELNLYYLNGAKFELINSYSSPATTSFVVFDFGKEITTTKFKFEYQKVVTNHKYVATAREIIFLQPECEEYYVYKNIFTDYSQTTLNESVNTFEKLCDFEEKLKNNINFSAISTKLNRAKMVAQNRIVYDKNREFSTNKNALNPIAQNGDIVSYCRNNLQFNAFGTNRQVLGILSTPNEVINVFVDAKSTDPLPKIRFSQHMGSWRSWLGGELQLKLGKNTFTTPNFKFSDYTIDVPLGGAIYLINPYSEQEQSDEVRVYIEGGLFYPVLTKNSDEKIYRNKLNEYAKKVEADPKNVVDLTEIVSDHAIATVKATKANELYKTNSPVKAIEGWNEYMDALLEFGGVTQDETNALFDKRNLYVNFNVRLVQPWPGAGAFAYTEHVGVYESWQQPLICGSGFGWGISHEIGHMMDNPNRTIGESTNNMYAKYNETALENLNSRGDFSKTTNALSSDLTYDSENFFVTNRLNFLVWWYIECWHKGYWAGLENCYRGVYPALKNFLATDESLKEKINTLSKTEKQVLYSSIVTGIDLSYYFDRWGYRVSTAESDMVFKSSTASETFNEVMAKAVSGGFVDNIKKPKLWYQTNMAYHIENTTPEYDSDTIVSIASVSKTNGGYSIFINHTENKNHLGYEILQGDEIKGYKVIGFTYESSFLDTTEYPAGYNPSYKIIAVDNTFGTCSASVFKQVVENLDIVCKIADTGYTTLQEAINEALDNDVITLIKSFETTNIVISKNLTVKIDDNITEDIILSKIESGNFITILQNKIVSIVGNANSKIILNGNNFSQNGALLKVGGKVNVSYVIFRNSISTGDGAGIVMCANVKGSTFEHCQFIENRAKIGATYYCNESSSNAIFNNCIFSNCTSTFGGVIASKGTLTLNECEISNNYAGEGIIKNYAGGILYAKNCEVKNNTARIGAGYHLDGRTDITGGIVSNNEASEKSGGLYYGTSVAVRKVTIIGTTFSENKAPIGAEMFVVNGTVTFSNANVIGYGEIRLNGGVMNIDGESNVQGTFAISNSALLVANGKLFQNIENCKFCFVNYVANMIILKAENFNLIEADLSKIKLSQQISVVLSENMFLAVPNRVSLTVLVEGQTKIFEYNYGEEVILNYTIEPTKYIEKYVDNSSNEFLSNYTFTITQNLSFTAIVKNKLIATFDYGDRIETIYFIPYEILNLPTQDVTNKKLIWWEIDEQYFEAGSTYFSATDCQFRAKYEELFKLVILNKENEIYLGYFEYDEIVDPRTLVDANKYDFYDENDVKISKISLSRDTTLKMLPTHNDDKILKDKLIYIISIVFVILLVLFVIIFYSNRKKKKKLVKQ